jgi:hypothetical protein
MTSSPSSPTAVALRIETCAASPEERAADNPLVAEALSSPYEFICTNFIAPILGLMPAWASPQS